MWWWGEAAVPNHSNIRKKDLQNFQGLREQTESMWSTGWGLHQIHPFHGCSAPALTSGWLMLIGTVVVKVPGVAAGTRSPVSYHEQRIHAAAAADAGGSALA